MLTSTSKRSNVNKYAMLILFSTNIIIFCIPFTGDEEAEESNTFGADQNFVLASCSLLMKYGASPGIKKFLISHLLRAFMIC